ncbi:MAG TPA: hypothetical protein VFP60_18165 [Pseudolabrys sp.]|nr:hypothetical protein [Pseudolabrys sp.]
MKISHRFALFATLCGTIAITSWVDAGFADLDPPIVARTRASIEGTPTTSAAASAEHVGAPRATAPSERDVSDLASGSVSRPDPRPMQRATQRENLFSPPDALRNETEGATCSVEVADHESSSTALLDLRLMPRLVALAVPAVNATDPLENAAQADIKSQPPDDACLESEVCIDQYLWSLYEQTPKVDTVKVEERIKVKVKKKGKMRTVVQTRTKYVTEDFGWKDPKAAQKVSMSVKDYVIGGMDRGFKRKLYKALRAMEDAGLSPGITSGFRDNYRQELASGNKAAPDSSYHGGSRRGGYGHGLAADLVSLKGATRAERWTSTESLWKWIDAHENELGIARPYLDKDPPHVAPIDGKEYADKRGSVKARLAGLKKPSPSSNQSPASKQK